MHWLDKYVSIDKFKEVAEEYEWDYILPENDDGPLEFECSDGSKCTIHKSPATNRIIIKYDPSEEAEEAMRSEEDRVMKYVKSEEGGENVLEWLEHYMKKHEESNS